MPPSPLNYSGKKAKNAQEAHEAIRPTEISRVPDDMKKLKSLGGGVIIAFAMFSFANRFKSNFHYLFIERLQLQEIEKVVEKIDK